MEKTTLDISKAKAFISELYDKSALPALAKYISIPNQSPAYDKEWATNGHMENAITLIVDWVKEQNVPDLTIEVVRLPERTPLIFITIPSNDKDAPTALLYGHMDKQPPLDEKLWKEGLHPYKPVFRDGKLYGRGGADDGYSTFSVIAALKAIKEQNIAHPRCVVLVEAREESGSQDLPAYVDHLKDRIGVPSLVVCLDSGCGNYDQFWMTSSLRGCIVGTIHVTVLKEAVHSGTASGVVPSSFRIIRRILDRIEEAETGRVLLKTLNKDIHPARIQQIKEATTLLGSAIVDEFPFVEGAKPMHDDLVEVFLNKTWRPTVSYTGVSGMPPVETAGNVLRTDTSLKISIRVPPHVDANEAAKELKEVVEKDPPYGAKVALEGVAVMSGWESPLLAPWLENAIKSGDNVIFGKHHAYLSEGGTIPFMHLLGQKFPQAQFVITGVLGPGSNAHGPNEFLHIEMTKNVTSMVAHLLVEHAKQK